MLQFASGSWQQQLAVRQVMHDAITRHLCACRYGQLTYQQRGDPDQGQDIAERLLYLAGNCCTCAPVAFFLNHYCSLIIVK